MKSLSLSVSAVVGLGLAASSAFAASTTQDLIVRYREPQNNLWQAMQTAQGSTAGSVTQAEILNGSEGVLKLHFTSAEQADLARAKLELSRDVLNVSPDYLYKPAITYRMEESASAGSPFQFYSLPLATADLPEIGAPPSNVKPGADPMAAKDWALTNIHMPSQSALESAFAGAKPIVAAVIDTGIDYNHEDLAGALWRNPENPREVGYDFAHNSSRPYDVVHFDIEGCLKDFGCAMGFNQGKFLSNPGHGTHCAGHVGAVANNSLGIRGIGGGKTQVMGLKFFFDADDDNAGQGDDAAAIKSIDYAVKHGARVISASWGARMKKVDADGSELKAALIRAQKAGVLVVIAAGNDGVDQDSVEDPDYPAAYDLDNLIVVAATDSADGLAKFSNFGGKSVHIGAPGVKIFSTTAGGTYNDVVAKFKDSSGKAQQLNWDGTSMATPIVAGAVSLVWSKYPNADYREIRDRILKSARKVSGLAGKVTSGGVLDVATALGN